MKEDMNMKTVKLGDFMQFNPTESFPRNKVGKKVAMEKLSTTDKTISGYEVALFNGGARFRNGDTLFAKITPCLENGKTAFVDILDDGEMGFGSTEFIVLRNNENSDANFVYYLAKSPNFREKAISLMEGTSGRKRVNEKALANEYFPLPPLPTQTAIAKVLSSLDDKIELNRKISAELESLARTFYDWYFVQNNKKDWKEESLYSIAIFTNGLACQKFRPKGDEFYKVIKIREMRDGFTKESELVDINIPQDVIVNDGDILFSWSASLEVMIWSGGIGGLNQHIFKVTSDNYPKEFVYFKLLEELNKFRVIAQNRKTTMGHITIDHLKQCNITIPDTATLQTFQKQVSPLFAQIVKARQESAELARLRDWLLPMLMNGEVGVIMNE